MDVPHLRQGFHPGDVVTAMDPVMVSFDGDTGDTVVFQRLQDFNGAGEGSGEYLAGVEQVAGNEDKINIFGNRVGHDAAEHAEKVFVAF